MFPTEFLDQKRGVVAGLQQWAGTREVEWHKSNFPDSQRANYFRLASFDIIFPDAEAVLFVEGQHQLGEFLVRDADAEFPLEQIAGSLGERSFVDRVNRLLQQFNVKKAVFDMRGVVLELFIDVAAGAHRQQSSF